MKEYTVDGEKVKVAFVGICTPETYTKSTPVYFQDENGNYIYSFCEGDDGKNLYKKVQDAVDAAKSAGATYVIAVAHTGVDDTSAPYDSYSIIKNTSKIDAYLDGHSHTVIKQEKVRNKDNKYVVLSSTGTKFANVGELVIDKSEGTIETSLISGVKEEDPETKAFVDSITAKFEETTNKVVAKSEIKLTISDPKTGNRIIRSQETNLGDLISDAYKDQLEADCAIVNGGGIRADIETGDLTYGDIIAAHPFGNKGCLAEVTGQQILDCLEMGARGTSIPNEKGEINEIGGFGHVSGISYDVDTTYESNVVLNDDGTFAKVDGAYRVKNVKINGKALDAKKKYKLASHDFYLKNCGDGMSMFKGCNIIKDEIFIDNEILINYITDTLGGVIKKDSIYGDVFGEGRINVITGYGKDYCFDKLQGYETVKKNHKYDMKSNKSGKMKYECGHCGKKVSVKLSKTSYTYNGKTRKPSMTITNASGKKLAEKKDYTVKYSNNKKVGEAKITVSFKGSYAGKLVATYKINPEATKIKSVTAKKGGFKVTYSKKKKQVTGYEVRYSTSKNMSKAVVKKIKKNSTTSLSVSKLKKNKKYYVQVRTYKTVNGKTFYSSWSDKKSVKTKK